MLKILKIKEDEYRKIFILSDIHGSGNLLEGMIKKIDYNNQDLFIFLGDSWDRGNQPKKVYDILMQLKKEANLIHLKGNHEKMLEDYYVFGEIFPYLIKGNGAAPTIEMFKECNDVLDEVLDFIHQMPYIVESETSIFVHAGLDLTKELELQDEEYVVWTKDKFWLRNSLEKKTIFYGHVIQEFGVIKIHENFNTIGMDCGSYKNKRIGCYELKTKNITYFSEDDYGK